MNVPTGARGRSGPPTVSVIVPARDAAPTIGRTLSCLQRQVADAPFEVIVVDDGSRDATAEIVRGFDLDVTLVTVRTSQGPGAARNRGVSVSRGDLLAFTDADCFPTPDWIACGIRAAAGIDVVQGRVIPDPTARRTPFDRTLVVDRDRGFYQTANLFVNRATFERVGGFRDWALERPRKWSVDRRRGRGSRTPIGEDTLFAWSALRGGARSGFAPDAVVHHAVVPGTLRDDISDRWHWTVDMPGLARFVPELREELFFRRWFFNGRTARMDLAIAAGLAAMVLGSAWPLSGLLPYLADLRRDLALRETGTGKSFPDDVQLALGLLAGDLSTVAGLATGSFIWRSLVI